MTNPIQVISSLEEFVSWIKNIHDLKFSDSSFEIRTVYRGHGNKEYKLMPSLFRDVHMVRNERIYLREFMRQMPNECNSLQFFDILCKAQHYGVPTRLLDFTLNPLVALFFACSSSKNNAKDGELVALTMYPLHYQDDIKVNTQMHYIFKFKKQMEWNTSDSSRLFRSLQSDNNVVDDLTIEGIEATLRTKDAILVKPNLTNDRVSVQKGVFALFNTPLTENGFSAPIDSSFHTESVYRAQIPCRYKKNILKDLDLLGMNEAYIFPNLQNGLRAIVDDVNTTNAAWKLIEPIG